MPLDVSILASGLSVAWAKYSVTSILAATEWATAYNTYATAAISCAGAPPILTNLPDLITDLKDTFESEGSYSSIANDIAAAHESFWQGVAFGPTGLVTLVNGTSVLKTGLQGLWKSQSESAVPITFVVSAQQHAALFDVFTKTVTVLDTAVPPPTGCTAPIS